MSPTRKQDPTVRRPAYLRPDQWQQIDDMADAWMISSAAVLRMLVDAALQDKPLRRDPAPAPEEG
jgi:hypothetical protein